MSELVFSQAEAKLICKVIKEAETKVVELKEENSRLRERVARYERALEVARVQVRSHAAYLADPCAGCRVAHDEDDFTYENMPTGARMECPKCKRWAGEVEL